PGADRRCGEGGHRRLDASREGAAAEREVQGPADRRAQRRGRAAIRSDPGEHREAGRSERAAAGGRGGCAGGALPLPPPGRPDGSLGDPQWIADARKKGTLPLLIVQGVLLTDLARAADVVLPGASFVEKEASYTNDAGRLQGTARAIMPPGDAMEDWQILVNL